MSNGQRPQQPPHPQPQQPPHPQPQQPPAQPTPERKKHVPFPERVEPDAPWPRK